MTQILLYLMIVLSAGGLGFIFGQGNLAAGVLGAVVLGITWIVSVGRQWRWFSFLGLFLVCTGAVFGIWVGLPPLGIIVSSLAALLAWDLDRFNYRLNLAAAEDDIATIERSYLGKLSIYTLVSLAITLSAVYIQIELTFFRSVFLVVVSIIGLLFLNRLFRQKSTEEK